MAVHVLSSTCSSVPLPPFPRRLSTSSRLRTAEGGSGIASSLCSRMTRAMCLSATFCVSPR